MKLFLIYAVELEDKMKVDMGSRVLYLFTIVIDVTNTVFPAPLPNPLPLSCFGRGWSGSAGTLVLRRFVQLWGRIKSSKRNTRLLECQCRTSIDSVLIHVRVNVNEVNHTCTVFSVVSLGVINIHLWSEKNSGYFFFEKIGQNWTMSWLSVLTNIFRLRDKSPVFVSSVHCVCTPYNNTASTLATDDTSKSLFKRR